ncbi:hypothetical protein EYF80_034703 [Liparis tanakae]|uniref:Uncharacterized protein n=1 Tax=Liparis tanakae TaxID=230148 RepID=A0A4Z2GQS6_9TELE|nr:hypothetical protein EYF80_034703 [Liparis tanakae]
MKKCERTSSNNTSQCSGIGGAIERAANFDWQVFFGWEFTKILQVLRLPTHARGLQQRGSQSQSSLMLGSVPESHPAHAVAKRSRVGATKPFSHALHQLYGIWMLLTRPICGQPKKTRILTKKLLTEVWGVHAGSGGQQDPHRTYQPGSGRKEGCTCGPVVPLHTTPCPMHRDRAAWLWAQREDRQTVRTGTRATGQLALAAGDGRRRRGLERQEGWGRRRARGLQEQHWNGARGGLTGGGSMVGVVALGAVGRRRSPAAALGLLEDVQALAQAAERGGRRGFEQQQVLVQAGEGPPVHGDIVESQSCGGEEEVEVQVEVEVEVRVVFISMISHSDLEVNGMYTTQFLTPRFDH